MGIFEPWWEMKQIIMSHVDLGVHISTLVEMLGDLITEIYVLYE